MLRTLNSSFYWVEVCELGGNREISMDQNNFVVIPDIQYWNTETLYRSCEML